MSSGATLQLPVTATSTWLVCYMILLQSNAGRFPVSFKCSLCFLFLNKDTFFGFYCCCREQLNEIVSLLSLLLLLENVSVIDNKTCSSQVVEHQMDFGRTRSFVDQRTPALEANAQKTTIYLCLLVR